MLFGDPCLQLPRYLERGEPFEHKTGDVFAIGNYGQMGGEGLEPPTFGV